jgi:hypothetical protein
MAESQTVHHRFLLVYKQWITGAVLLKRILNMCVFGVKIIIYLFSVSSFLFKMCFIFHLSDSQVFVVFEYCQAETIGLLGDVAIALFHRFYR